MRVRRCGSPARAVSPARDGAFGADARAAAVSETRESRESRGGLALPLSFFMSSITLLLRRVKTQASMPMRACRTACVALMPCV